jgi:hypothetical protein
MANLNPHTRPTRAFALAALLAAFGLLVAGVGAAAAKPAKTLGKTKRTPAPSCPKQGPNDSCEAVGSVTGFQMVADGNRAPFKAREDGTIVAWSLDLSAPKKSESSFFGDFYESNQFGMAPTARVSVLKRRDGRNYKLKKQSPVVSLNSVLGTRQTFTLTDPLKIRKGEFLALTIPTWAPSFAVGLNTGSNLWRSSRDAGRCGANDPNQIKNGKPQQKVGSTREYGCDYKGARLLYWGYYVPR